MAYTLSQEPELFDAFFITSPSIGPDSDQTFDDLKLVFKQDLDFPTFVYLSIGGVEPPRDISGYESLATVLRQHLPAQVTFFHEINEGQDHHSNDAISIARGLKMYFSSKPVAR